MRVIGLDPGLRRTGWGVIESEGARLRHVANGVVETDERAARSVVTNHASFWQLGTELLRLQAERLAEDDPERLPKHRMQVDALDKLRRVYNTAEHMAISILPRGVLAGEIPGPRGAGSRPS